MNASHLDVYHRNQMMFFDPRPPFAHNSLADDSHCGFDLKRRINHVSANEENKIGQMLKHCFHKTSQKAECRLSHASLSTPLTSSPAPCMSRNHLGPLPCRFRIANVSSFLLWFDNIIT